MAAQSITTIYIGNKEIKSFKRLILQQNINDHHTLRIECQSNSLENQTSEFTSETKTYLGEDITVSITSKTTLENDVPLEFFGIVTSVRNSKGYLDNNLVTITAHSPTIIADDGPHYHSYIERDLNTIVQNTLSNYDTRKLSTVIQANYTSPIPYAVQHKESNWQFVSRLASQYGEWLYYNGTKMIFGAPENTTPIVLIHNFDLKEFALNLTPIPNKFNYFTNDYVTDEHHTKKSIDINTGANGHHSFMNDKADLLYTAETNVWVNNGNSNQLKALLDNQADLQKKTAEQQQVSVEGTSDNPGVSLGKIINITGKTENYGEFRVAQISHQQDYLGNYSNTFKAYSTQLDVFPHTNFEAFPYSDSQTAIVIENSDPDGMARIKVQLPWQKFTGQATPWIRVVTPHGGGDKGFHFIPEIGEEVLIGFEGGSAERPYMLGSLYNSNAAASSFQSNTNNIKTIRTRSGHTIELNDTDGAEKIQIYDNEGSIIIFDTQAKSLFITATENIEFQAKNIKMIAEENIDIQAQGNIATVAEGDITSQSQGSTTMQATGDTNISSEASITIEASSEASLKGQTLTTEGIAAATLKGSQTKVEGQIIAIQGASGKIDVI